MLLEPHTKLLYLGTASQTQIDLFVDQFYRATKLELIQLTPALILDREFHTTPAALPNLELSGNPNAPTEPAIGRDFLTWLLYYCEKVGKVTVGNNEFDAMIEAPLLFSGDGDALGAGEAAIKKGDSPIRSAEVKAALGVGKKLRKAKVSLTRDDNSIWSGTFDADNFVFGSFKLPESEEMNPDEVFADRVRALGDFREAWIEYFKLFAKAMLEKGTGYFIHRDGVLLGLGIVEEDTIHWVSAQVPGGGRGVLGMVRGGLYFLHLGTPGSDGTAEQYDLLWDGAPVRGADPFFGCAKAVQSGLRGR